MAQLDKNDLVQMNDDDFKSLNKERLVEVAKNLHQLATELWEKQQQNSANSSKPPSSDNPYSSNLTRSEVSQSQESEFPTQAKPGFGYVSEIEGRARDLKLTEASGVSGPNVSHKPSWVGLSQMAIGLIILFETKGVSRTKKHLFKDILVIAILAVISTYWS